MSNSPSDDCSFGPMGMAAEVMMMMMMKDDPLFG
jgi:hypothetical protein